MLETKTFTENPFKFFWLIGIIFGVIILFFSFVVFSIELPQITNGKLNKSAIVIVGSWAMYLGGLLILFLIFSIEPKIVLECDFNRCRILKSNFGLWQSARLSDEFKWSEVIDTIINEKEEETSSDGTTTVRTVYTIVMQTKEREISLITLNKCDKNEVKEMMDYINKAAPQTKYVWVQSEMIGNRLAVDSKYDYSKVAREI